MKKILKKGLWLTGILVGVLIVAVIALKMFFPAEKIKAMAIERGSAALGRDLAVEGIDVSVWGGIGVTLENVSVSSPEDITPANLFEADNIDIKLQLFPLISGEYRIDRLIINRPRIVMVRKPDGRNNFTFKTVDSGLPEVARDMPAETKAAAAAVSFDRLEINDAQLSYTDDSTDIRLSLVGFDLATSLENPREAVYRSSGSLRIDSLFTNLNDRKPLLAVELEYEADYDLGRQLLSLGNATLTINGIKAVIKGNIEHGEQLQARVSLSSEDISVADLLNLLPPKQKALTKDYTVSGRFGLDVNLDYDASRSIPLSYSGNILISDTKISNREIAGEFLFGKALIDFKPDNVRLIIEDGSFDGRPIKGHLVIEGFDDPLLNAELAGEFNLGYIQPFLPAEAGHEIEGRGKIDVKLSGRTSDYKNMTFSGNLSVSEGKYNSTLVPEPVESFTLDCYFDNRTVRIDRLSASMASGKIDFSGRVTDLLPYMLADSIGVANIFPDVDGRLIGSLDLSFLDRFLPPEGNPHMTGDFEADLQVAGTIGRPESFRPRGSFVVSGGSYSDSLLPEPVESFEASLFITPDTIEVRSLNAKFTSSDLSLSGKLANPFPFLLPIESVQRDKMKKPLFLFSLTSHYFDVDRLFPEAVPGAGSSEVAAPVDSVSPIFLPDIDARGTISVDTAIYSKIELTNVHGKVVVRDRKIEISNVTSNVYTGKATGKTTIDLNDLARPHYVGEFKASQIEADDFMARFTKFGGHLFGKIDVSGSYDAYGWDPDAFLNSLNMTGVGSMKEGKIVTSGAVYSAISSLAGKAGTEFSQEQPFRGLNSAYKVTDGKVFVDKMKAKLGNVGDLDLDGFYAFNGRIDYKGSILLSPEWTQKLLSQSNLLGVIGNFLTDKSVDRIRLPLVIGGTIDKPKLNFDFDALTKKAGENAAKDAVGGLLNLFKKKDKK